MSADPGGGDGGGEDPLRGLRHQKKGQDSPSSKILLLALGLERNDH